MKKLELLYQHINDVEIHRKIKYILLLKNKKIN